MDTKAIVKDITEGKNAAAKTKIYAVLHEKVMQKLDERKVEVAKTIVKGK